MPVEKDKKLEGEEDEDEEFSFVDWIASTAISNAGMRKLETAEIKDESAILFMDDVTLLTVKLAAGDYVKFKRAQSELKAHLDKPPGLVNTDSVQGISSNGAAKGGLSTGNGAVVTGQVLKAAPPTYTLDQLAAFLAGKSLGSETGLQQPSGVLDLNILGSGVNVGGMSSNMPFASLPPPSNGGGYGPNNLAGNNMAGNNMAAGNMAAIPHASSSVMDLNRSLMKDVLCLQDSTTNASGEKPLLPCNFISNTRGTMSESEEVVHTGDGTQLVLKKTARRPSPDKLTAGQWVSANVRILQRLIPAFSTQELSDYFDYTIGVGDSLQLFTTSSVMILDNEHRIDVHKTGRRWNNVDSRLENRYLKRKEEVQGKPQQQVGAKSTFVGGDRSGGGRSSDRPRSGNICWQFNSAEGCPFHDRCRFSHVDSEASASKQNARAPRFMNRQAGPASNNADGVPPRA
jgi:hypothetical protein